MYQERPAKAARRRRAPPGASRSRQRHAGACGASSASYRASFCRTWAGSASDYAVARSAEHPLKHRDGARVVRKNQALHRGVVVPAVARSVRDHRAPPNGGEDVQVARPALLFEPRLTARAGDRPREGARQAARARSADRRLERESLGRYTRVTLEARERDRFTLEIGRIDTQGQAIADLQLGVLAEAVARAAADP